VAASSHSHLGSSYSVGDVGSLSRSLCESHSLSSLEEGGGGFAGGAASSQLRESHLSERSQLSYCGSRMGGGTGYGGFAHSHHSPSLSSLSGTYGGASDWGTRTPVRTGSLGLAGLQLTPKRGSTSASSFDVAAAPSGSDAAGAQGQGAAPTTPTQTQLDAARRKEALLAEYARLNLTPRLGALQSSRQ
jgi:hypothetical protein